MKNWSKPEILSLNFRQTKGQEWGEGDDLLIKDSIEKPLEKFLPFLKSTSPTS